MLLAQGVLSSCATLQSKLVYVFQTYIVSDVTARSSKKLLGSGLV